MVEPKDFSEIACKVWEYNPTPAELAVRFKASNITYLEAGYALGTSGQNIFNWCKNAEAGVVWGSTQIYLFMKQLAMEGVI